MGGIFIHLRHRQGIDRTGFDTIATKYAFRNVDVELTGKSLQWTRLILRADDLNTTGGQAASQRSQPDTTFLVHRHSVRRPSAPRCVSGMVRCSRRILERNGTMEHMLERDLHRVPNFRKEGGLQTRFVNAPTLI